MPVSDIPTLKLLSPIPFDHEYWQLCFYHPFYMVAYMITIHCIWYQCYNDSFQLFVLKFHIGITKYE